LHRNYKGLLKPLKVRGKEKGRNSCASTLSLRVGVLTP
jgi:hypothetical protein